MCIRFPPFCWSSSQWLVFKYWSILISAKLTNQFFSCDPMCRFTKKVNKKRKPKISDNKHYYLELLKMSTLFSNQTHFFPLHLAAESLPFLAPFFLEPLDSGASASSTFCSASKIANCRNVSTTKEWTLARADSWNQRVKAEETMLPHRVLVSIPCTLS